MGKNISDHEPLYYIRDTRGNTGSNVVFWRENGNGYGTGLDGLEICDKSKAQRMHDNRNSDVPLLKALVDAASILAVDCQYLPDGDTVPTGGDQYVVQIARHWNGNDILFVGSGPKNNRGRTYDYTKAGVLTWDECAEYLEDDEQFKVFLKSSIDSIARRTFQIENITRDMTKGIKLKRPRRKRPTTGKMRHNCNVCGKIYWDRNYDPDAPKCDTCY